MVRKAFTLIELMITIFITSILSLALFQNFSHTQKTVNSISNIIDIDLPLMAFFTQMEKDVTGMFVPVSTKEFYENQEREKKKQDKSQKDESTKENKKEKKYIKDIFYIDIQNDGEILISFITSGGLNILDKNGNVKPEPYIRRVAYLFKKDPDNPQKLKLIYRYDAQNLELQNILSSSFANSYEIMNNIKKVNLELKVFEYIEKDSKQHAKEESKQDNKSLKDTGKISSLTKWEEANIFEKYKALIPAYFIIKGTYTDKNGKVEYPFDFYFKVFAYYYYKPDKEVEKPEEKEQEGEKSVLQKIDEFFEKKVKNTALLDLFEF